MPTKSDGFTNEVTVPDGLVHGPEPIITLLEGGPTVKVPPEKLTGGVIFTVLVPSAGE